MPEPVLQTIAAVPESFKLREESDNRVTESIAGRFISALTELEAAREVGQIVALFSEDCEIGNVIVPGKFYGTDGARRFWTSYRHAFEDVCSVFEQEIYTGNEAQLKWTTEGKSRRGRKVKYDGVSLMETEDGKITRFYAHFDRQDLERQLTA